MTDSATIERKTVSMPNAPRRLTRKSEGRKILPLGGKFISDGAIAIEAKYWPKGGAGEELREYHRPPSHFDSMTEDLIGEFPSGSGGNMPEISVNSGILDDEGKIDTVTPSPSYGEPKYGFDVRYWVWIKKLGLTVHYRPDSDTIIAAPHPIRNYEGEVVGVIMPYCIVLTHGRTVADIA